MGQSCPKGTDAVGCASRPQLVENELLYKKKNTSQFVTLEWPPRPYNIKIEGPGNFRKRYDVSALFCDRTSLGCVRLSCNGRSRISHCPCSVHHAIAGPKVSRPILGELKGQLLCKSLNVVVIAFAHHILYIAPVHCLY